MNANPDARLQAVADEPEQGTTWLDALRLLRKHLALVLAVTVAVSLAVTFYTLGKKKIYQSSATVLFDPNPPRPLGKQVDTVVDMGSGNYWNNKEYYETQYELMRSLRVALAVVHDLGLHRDPAFLQNASPGAKVKPQEVKPEEAAELLLRRVTVQPVKNSRLADLKYEDADPERAQRITSAMVETYVAKNLEDVQSSTGSAVEWLNGQLDKLKSNLDSSELALHEYKLNKNILSLDIDSQSNMLREEMQQLNRALTEVRIRREELTARRTELLKIKADDPKNLPATELLENSLLSQLRNGYLKAVSDRDALIGSGKGENHPEVRAAEAQVQTAKEALLAEVRNIQGAVERDLAIVRQQEGGLAGLFERAKRQALDLNLLGIEYNRLFRTKENSEKLYELVLERTKEGDLTRMMQVNNIRVVDRPLLPNKPIRPRTPLNILLGLMAGLALGVGAAFGREMLDRTVKTQADIEQRLGLTFLGLLPAVSAQSAKKSRYYGRNRPVPVNTGELAPELIVHQSPMSGPAEAARSVRTNIQFMSPDQPFRTLLVTSAGPAEGKTTVATSLAIAMAQAGQKVVLVDGDLRRPRVHRIFNKSSDIGLTVALMDSGVLTDEVMRTDIPNLSVVPAGPIPPNPAEILQSDKFADLLRDLRNRFDRVVIDSPPVVPVTDAAVLSTQVDGAILVVRAFTTSREFAQEASRALQGVGGRIAGVVLNAVELDRSEYRHYHYSYYRKGGYYRADRTADAEQAS